MLDTDVIPNGNKRIPVQALKTADFMALTLNTVFVSLAAVIALVVAALFLGVPDYSLSDRPSTFGIVSGAGLASLLVVDFLVPYVVALNILSFALKTINDSRQSWRFLLTRTSRYSSIVVAILLAGITIAIITNIGLNNS